MKKFLIILLLFLSSTIVLAAESPRWVSQPISVYIPQYGNFTPLMKKAFASWQHYSKNLVRFQYVNNPNNAQIQVEFVDFVTNCSSNNHTVGCTQLAIRGKNFYRSLITIGTKEYAKVYSNGLYKSKLQYRQKKNIYGVMLHEVGHALGLEHSKNDKSIMFPYDLPTLQYLTKDDLNLLYKKYH